VSPNSILDVSNTHVFDESQIETVVLLIHMLQVAYCVNGFLDFMKFHEKRIAKLCSLRHSHNQRCTPTTYNAKAIITNKKLYLIGVKTSPKFGLVTLLCNIMTHCELLQVIAIT
jgi:hypothetical protein